MSRRPWTRRELLYAGAGCGLFAAGRALWPHFTLPASLFAPAGGAPAGTGAGASLSPLIRAAPIARYWVSNTSTQCTACHAQGLLSPGAKPAHKTATIRCQLCARGCSLGEGERGSCRARVNVGGEMRTLVYGRPITIHLDPIEKKPFYHFLPGSTAFSLATSGCPLRCRFCQNWEISQARPEDYDSAVVSPESIAAAAVTRAAHVIAFTYNEPTVFVEYLTDIARAARAKGRRSVLVSCGYMTEAPLAEMCETLDAIKIDLKGFSEDFYRTVCGAELAPVLRSIRQVAKSGRHLEIVNLMVPTLNDSPMMLREMVKWMSGELGPDVPIHFTRFHPDYQLTNLSPTPVATLERARELAREAGIRYAYVGNVPGHPGNNTYCPKCGKAVIERSDFFVTASHLVSGRCGTCGTKIAGVWS